LLRCGPGGPQGGASELNRALGQVIGVLEELVDDFVEELVKGDEARPLDVPVRLLGLKREVQSVSELLVQEVDRT
jgi:hypothetical protein